MTNQAWTMGSDGTQYNLEAFRREYRKRDHSGTIHMHAPLDECSDHEHEVYEDGELVKKSSAGMVISNG